MLSLNKSRGGFTLIELIVVLTIMGILASMVIENSIIRLRFEAEKQTIRLLNMYTGAVSTYFDTQSKSPASIDDLREYVTSGVHDPTVDIWGNKLNLYVAATELDPTQYITYKGDKCFLVIVSNGRNGVADHVYNSSSKVLTNNGDDYVFCYPVGAIYNTRYYRTKQLVDELNIRCQDYRNSCGGCTPADLDEIISAGYIEPGQIYDFYGVRVIYESGYGIYSAGNNRIDDSKGFDDILPATTCF